MGLSRGEMLALGGSALVAVAVPAMLVTGGARPGTGSDAAPALLAGPAPPPPLVDVYTRALFAGGTAAADEAPLPGDAPQLMGIAGRIGRDAVAMVRAGDRTRTLELGQGIDGWTLESLTIDAAYFMRGGQRARVPLPAGE